MSLQAFFNPASIAIVGVSENPKKVGYLVAQNCIKQGYTGKLFLVNPKHKELFGKTLYPSLQAIKEPIDLAVLATPNDVSLKLLDELNTLGVKNVIIYAAGFRETDEAGRLKEEELIQKANDYGMTILGPNCIGYINTMQGVNLTFLKHVTPAGNIGFISQSGALGSLMVDFMVQHKNYGFSYFISLGNKTVIDETDCLRFLMDDPHTKVIGMYLEDVKRGQEFQKALCEASLKKPVVILKSGSTAEGSKAAISHTGSMMGNDDAYTSVFRQNGAIRAKHFLEFRYLLKMYSYERVPVSRDVLILSNAGGLGVLLTDEIINQKLSLVTVTDEVKNEILKTMGAQRVTVHNPIDLLGDASAFHYRQAIQTTMKEKTIGAVVILLTPQANTEIEETTSAIIEAQTGFDKPIYPVFMGQLSVGNSHDAFEEKRIASFSTYDLLPTALRKMREREEWKEREQHHVQYSMTNVQPESKTAIDDMIKANVGKPFLNLPDSMKALELIGIPTIAVEVVSSFDGLRRIVEKIGYPVVLKIYSDKLTHKTEAGGVIAGIKNDTELEEAYKKLTSVTGNTQVLVQKMVKGYELIVGAKRDEIFGTILVVGLGGVIAELIKEVARMTYPVSYDEFVSIISETKLNSYVKGFRGMTPLDLKSLYDAAMKVGQLFETYPQITELDINPLMVVEGIPTAIDGRIIL